MHFRRALLPPVLLAVVLLTGFGGCAGSPRRNSPAAPMRRDSDGASLEVMPPFPLACQEAVDREQMAFTYGRRRNRFDESVYEISIVNIGRPPLAVAEGGSLTCVLDGRSTVFRTFGAADTLRDGPHTIPVAATYVVTYADLVGLSEAASVRLTLDANGRPVDGCFDRRSTANLKRFVELYPPR